MRRSLEPYRRIDKPSPYQSYFGTTLLFDSYQKWLRDEVSDYLMAIETELDKLDQAIARMNDGTFAMAAKQVKVTIGGCGG